MRIWVDHFIASLNKKKLNEKTWLEVDYYGFDQIVNLIQDRYHIVFTKPKWRKLKIEKGDHNVEELVDYKKLDWRDASRVVMSSYREDICKLLEKLYIYIVTQPQDE